MKEQIIDVEPSDDVASIRDKLRWARADKVLLILPDGAEHRIARSKLDLLLLQREAARHSAALALVTHDHVIIDFAREIELPCFGSVEENRARRWAAPPRPRILDQPAASTPLSPELVEAGTRLHAQRSILPPSIESAWLRWRWAIAGGAALIAGLLLVPGASITIEPLSEQVSVSTPIIADPQAAAVDVDSASIPARIVGVDVDATATTDTTGSLNVPTDKAQGTVLFTNLIPDQTTIPAGTTVRTSGGIPVKFLTQTDVTLPGRVGATVTAPIQAAAAGFEGNLQTNKINTIDGPLGARVAVINPSPTSGGNAVPAQAVSQQDYDRVRALAIQQIQQRALADMRIDPYIKLLDTEFIPTESLLVVLVNAETYSASVGDTATTLSLTMRATVQGTAIDERSARQVVYSKMAEIIGEGFEIRPDTLVFKKGQVTAIDANRRLTFVMDGAGDMTQAIDLDQVRLMVDAVPAAEAQARLQQSLQLAAPPTITIWPGFWPLMPILPFRIAVTSAPR